MFLVKNLFVISISTTHTCTNIILGSANNLLTVEKLNAINTILDAFGNSKTCMNSNASRYTQLCSLQFDNCGMIVSAQIKVSNVT